MSHELLEFISPLCSPELAGVLSDLDDLLLKYQFNGHDDELQQLYSIAENRDRETLIDDICFILRTGAYTVLRGMGVELDPEAPFPIVHRVTEVLLGFEGADDYEYLLSILDYDMAPDEVLCEILEARSELVFEDFAVVLVKVDPELIARMKKVLQTYEQSVEQARDTKEILQRLNIFHTDNPDSLAVQAMDQGIPPGVTMEDLYQVFEDQLVNRPLDKAVKDLVGLSILSGVSTEALSDEIQYFMEDLYPALEDRMNASKFLKRELEQYQQLMQNTGLTC